VATEKPAAAAEEETEEVSDAEALSELFLNTVR
jgi:hypothetical protein